MSGISAGFARVEAEFSSPAITRILAPASQSWEQSGQRNSSRPSTRIRMRPAAAGTTPRHRRSIGPTFTPAQTVRSEEHTSELQSHLNLVCRLLLEKKKINIIELKRNNQYQ